MMKIPLRTFQRQTSAFLDLLATNEGLWGEVVDGEGKVLFLASDPRSPMVLARQEAPLTGVKEPATKEEKFLALKANLDAIVTPDRLGRDHDVFGPSLAAEELREDELPVSPEDFCQKCKKPSELYLYEEEGLEYRVCALCAIKAKIPMARMKKL
jgi:hypothetical protein